MEPCCCCGNFICSDFRYWQQSRAGWAPRALIPPCWFPLAQHCWRCLLFPLLVLAVTECATSPGAAAGSTAVGMQLSLEWEPTWEPLRRQQLLQEPLRATAHIALQQCLLKGSSARNWRHRDGRSHSDLLHCKRTIQSSYNQAAVNTA